MLVTVVHGNKKVACEYIDRGTAAQVAIRRGLSMFDAYLMAGIMLVRQRTGFQGQLIASLF